MAKKKKGRQRWTPGRRPASPPAPDVPPVTPPARQVTVWDFLHRALELPLEFLRHHFVLTAAGLAVAAVIAVFLLATRKTDECITINAKIIGEIQTCSKPTAQAAPAPDDAEDKVYADMRAGYRLAMREPDDWSVFPAIDVPDPQSGGTAKAFSIPPGIVADIPITILTDEAATAFVSRTKVREGVVSLWVYRLAARVGPVERFINEETGPLRLRKTGAPVATYLASLMGSDALARIGQAPTKGDVVRVSTVAVSPDHRSALVLWVTPYPGVEMDIVGRFVVGDKDTYYIVAVRPKPADPKGDRLNADVRRMIESLRPL